MARAETIESVGENESGGNGPLPCHNTCRMEVPRPLHTWPNMLITRTSRSRTSGISAQLRHNHHHLEPFQSLNLSYLTPYSHPEGEDEPRQLSPSPTPPHSPPSSKRNGSSQGTVAPSDLSGEHSDSDREEEEELQHVSSRQGPLPDLLPQNEHPSWAIPHLRDPRGEAVQELDVRRVASQLRLIGDEFNATVLLRAHGAPHWQDLRDVCRGLLNFITQTLSTLYRLT